MAKGKCLDAINDGLNTNERTSNIKTKFYKPNDAYCSQNESEMCCRTTLINETVTDKDGALAARELAREEGMLLGYSAGSALAGLRQMKDRLKPSDVVVLLIHDHGSRYVEKIYNDEWMKNLGWL